MSLQKRFSNGHNATESNYDGSSHEASLISKENHPSLLSKKRTRDENEKDDFDVSPRELPAKRARLLGPILGVLRTIRESFAK